ncbi:glutamate synthase-related protein [Terriglobus sp. 2YAB30_2]|uniref:glutamate synthase-related protein n=1 Tax=Terriglobus sp. 2YAB30_2 TaxID=3233023 RepID=UPI003F9C7E29
MKMSVPSLLDSRFDHDSCGVGFVAQVSATPSYDILAKALTALARLAHRGAVAADGKSSDGVGIMAAVPRALLLEELKLDLPAGKPLAVGMCFLPVDSAKTEAAIVRSLELQSFKVLAWRTVPTRPETLGEIALSTMPVIKQVIATTDDTSTDVERRLYLARKKFDGFLASGEADGYLCSLSTQTIVYKSMCAGRLLPEFFPDLANQAFVTSFALFHQRYATNTTPTWHRAQPCRALAHNGEINTVWGNRARMAARDATLPDECKPILTQGGSDSTSLDETVELLRYNGRTLPESLRMLVPPAYTAKPSSFLQYHVDMAEPWDGPAALGFADGKVVGAALDRNGLRPSRYAVTNTGVVVAGSEAGLVDLDPNTVIESGRLGPGEMFVVDLIEHKVLHNDELFDLFDADPTYQQLLAEQTPLLKADIADTPDLKSLLPIHLAFGYTKEEVRMILAPMATEGKDPVWSMGDDTPLAFLAKAPRPLYAYFRQRFAQVTNPAIDPLREACVVSLHTRLGPWSHMLDKHAPLPGLSLFSPFLSLGQAAALREHKYDHAANLKTVELPCLFDATTTLEAGLEAVGEQAVSLVHNGAGILLLTDRGASAASLPIPMAMATAYVNEVLIKAGLRANVGIAVEAGDCRDIHHAAVLIGYGAGAVCPWLALESGRALTPAGTDPYESEKKMLKALDTGLAKIMSKMGVSVVDSYRSAHLFDILGLHLSVVDKCFPATPAPISGIGFTEIEQQLRKLWGTELGTDLTDPGWVKFRRADGTEPHGWAPPLVKELQTVVGSARNVPAAADPAAAFQIYTQNVASREPAFLRDLLEIRPAGQELPVSAVEAPEKMYRRFIASAMSLGSLSPEAHSTITLAMNTLGGKSNTGEGGEDPGVYKPSPAVSSFRTPGGGVVTMARNESEGSVAVAEPIVEAPAIHGKLNNKIKQVASGRFGVTAEYLANAEEIEIKVAQGAKPGEGGQLPGHKVSGLIARLRHAQPGVPLISPPPHHDIYSIEDLAQLIHDLKHVNPRAAVGVKLVSSCGVGTVAAGVAKAYADYIVIAGNTGGTGAAALSSIKYAGNPWELGLAEAQQVLIENGMRGRVRLRTDGGLSTARDILVAALLGADEFAFGTAVLVTLGCDMARQCHLNSCPTGIATQKPELRAKFRGKPEHVVQFFQQLASEVQQLLARYGLPSLEAAIGRADLLEQVRFDGGLDLKPMLAVATEEGAVRWQGGRNDRPVSRPAVDEAWVAPAIDAAKQGMPYRVHSDVANRDRAIGARIAGELALLKSRAEAPLPRPDITLNLNGTAGQSFGCFAVDGMKLILEGQANDFVGKGLAGGEIILRARGLAAQDSGHHVILGNVALYGATSGTLFAAGRAGERFAVRNSGATAVVEGIGDHGCEYMTGGMAVILGKTGINFGAGMTGGIAWVYDADGSFMATKRCHEEFLAPETFEQAGEHAQMQLHELIEAHVERSNSSLAKTLLADWANASQKFVRLVPKPQA